MSNNLNITYKGVTKSLRAWAREYGLSYSVAQHRYSRGWTVEEILDTPVRLHTSHGLNPNTYRPELVKTYNQQRRLKVLQAYSKEEPHCLHCGITDVRVLTLDHINQDGANDRRINGSSSQALFSRLIRDKYPSGFRVLCCNCNRIAYLEWKGNI